MTIFAFVITLTHTQKDLIMKTSTIIKSQLRHLINLRSDLIDAFYTNPAECTITSGHLRDLENVIDNLRDLTEFRTNN